MAQRTPIQMIAQVRSDMADRSELVELSTTHMQSDGIARVTAEQAGRQYSDDTFQLLGVLLTQPPESMGDMLSMACAIAEVASQVFVSDDADVNDAGDRVRLAAEAMVAFLGRKVRAGNQMDRNDVERCRRNTAARFATTVEA